MYDYGEAENLLIYKSPSPPEIQLDTLGTIKYDSMFYLGGADPYVPYKSMTYFKKLVPQAEFHVVDGYNHLDYLWSKSAKEKIYIRIIEKLIRNS
jgi:pimeloyl-ACP methyl ester carboxylesterase